MTMAAATGEHRTIACDCGATVTERELRLYPPPAGSGPTYWSRDHHRAPCGFQCSTGGIRAEGALHDGTFIRVRDVLNQRRFHGTFGVRVGACPCREVRRG